MTTIEPEQTIESESVFAGNLIQVRKDTVRLPNGKTTVREIVEHAETIAVLPLLEDGRIVFVRQFRKPAERVLLEVPAGGIDQGESPEEAVRREMVEETGYRVGSLTRLCAFFTSPGFTTEYMHLYKAEGLQPGKATEETDQIEVVLLTPAEARERIAQGEIADSKSILAVAYASGLLLGT